MHQLLLFSSGQSANSHAQGVASPGMALHGENAGQGAFANSAAFQEALQSAARQLQGAPAQADSGQLPIDPKRFGSMQSMATMWQSVSQGEPGAGMNLPPSFAALLQGGQGNLLENQSMMPELSAEQLSQLENILSGLMQSQEWQQNLNNGTQQDSPLNRLMTELESLLSNLQGQETPATAQDLSQLMDSFSQLAQQLESRLQSMQTELPEDQLALLQSLRDRLVSDTQDMALSVTPVGMPAPLVNGDTSLAALAASVASMMPQGKGGQVNVPGTAAGNSVTPGLLHGPSHSAPAGAAEISEWTQFSARLDANTTNTSVSGAQGSTPAAQQTNGEVLTQSAQAQNFNQLMSQPSAEADQNFKLAMEQALSTNPDGASEVADEATLTRLNDSANTKAAELANRNAQRPYATQVNVPVNDPQWSAKMNEKVIWMASRGVQQAQIHLNPAELGPVDVKVSVQNEQTVISFNVQNASVRELLESNVQRLRDMMDANGVDLAEVNVDDGSAEQQFAQQYAEQESGQTGPSQSGDSAEDGDEDSTLLSQAIDLDNLSLIDDYA